MIRFSGRLRSALIIGLQGIRSRKLRTLLSMVSLFLGVLAVVVVQAGASIAERAVLADMELYDGFDGTVVMEMGGSSPKVEPIVLDTVAGRSDAVAMTGMQAIIGEPGVRPVNQGGGSFDDSWGGSPMICDEQGNCREQTPAELGPQGQAIELRLTALTGDVRQFRPYRPQAGQWLDFTSVPMMAPRLVLNKEAAKGFDRYKVPAEMRVPGASANMTPQFVGVVDDGDASPRAYVRLDELTQWVPAGKLVDPNMGEVRVLMSSGTPVEQVLTSKLKAVNIEPYVHIVNSREEQESELALMRWIFLAMAGLVLLIGVAGILNVGLATVGERVEEFALRRAVGTPRALLAGIVLAETLITGLLTAALAIGASAAALKALVTLAGDSQPFLQGVEFPWEAGVAGVIAGLVAGVLGGFVPAIRAAGIPIATVMRA
ncbi:ABC transporter permease [Actinoplanes sp. NEAU-A12]|uniref:ABC transporter permease n=1 Tax=Actinoplanes sandaracinus TaxID=3045177 RepID=A0ABT6WXG5_9ACTN|nr:ABC transporter permease [Actinoplanes sandaracinus]MDI6104431.1 ABC transporter permease [Actinoplanes sandaracinus]